MAGETEFSGPRVFLPGSEWLYIKLYSAPGTLDGMLSDAVAKLIDQALESGLSDRCFFIRYADPEWHLRLRFHGEPDQLYASLLPRLHQMAEQEMAQRRIWRVSLDSYEPEIERYGGGQSIRLAEQYFCADSAATMAILRDRGGAAELDERWRWAIYGIDRLLDDFGLALEDKAIFLARLYSRFSDEFTLNKGVVKALSNRFRAERPKLERLLEAVGHETDHGAAVQAFDVRSRSTREVTTKISGLHAAPSRDGVFHKFVGSLIHMHVNRLLRCAHRKQELVIYSLMSKLYQSRLARQRKAEAA